jgi:chemotaxis protein methyltransferase CheR
VLNEFALTEKDFRQIAQTLESCAGIALPQSKRTLVYSRLIKRLRAVGVQNFSDYCTLVLRDKDEQRKMIEALTTNTTSFFREGHHFSYLKTELDAHLVPALQSGTPLRFWSAACSSGEEPYSIALTILQSLTNADRFDCRILATDINSSILERAAAGVYSTASLESVPGHLRSRYFDATQSGDGSEFRVNQNVRSLVRFGLLNLQEKWPMRGRFDGIFCRNVMIYFSPETQERLWIRFAELLKPHGVLYIGHSERVTGPASSILTAVAPTTYVRQGGTA